MYITLIAQSFEFWIPTFEWSLSWNSYWCDSPIYLICPWVSSFCCCLNSTTGIIRHFISYWRVLQILCLFAHIVQVIRFAIWVERKAKRRFVLNSFRIEDAQALLWLPSKESFVCPCIKPFYLSSCDLSRVKLCQFELVHDFTMLLILHDSTVICTPSYFRDMTSLEQLLFV